MIALERYYASLGSYEHMNVLSLLAKDQPAEVAVHLIFFFVVVFFFLH